MKKCVRTLLEAFDGHDNGNVKKNNQRECLYDLIAEKEALVGMIVEQEASIVKLQKGVKKLKMFLV